MIKQNADYIGRRIGNYDIVEQIGLGGISTVYKGHHSGLDRYAAIKVMHGHFVSDSRFYSMFLKEAKNLAALTHPNIVQVYDVGAADDSPPYIVMEYIAGQSLDNLLEQNREKRTILPLEEAVRIVKHVAEALSFAHRKNIIHCDVKPGNVLLERTGRIVLADFGFAKLITGNTEIVSGTLRGTPAYISPEIVKGLPKRGTADVYSLGVLFYELVTGELPFMAEEPIAIALKHINEAVRPPRRLMPDLPEKIEKIIMTALQKNPADRYQTMDIMLKDINLLEEANTDHLPTATLSLANKPLPEMEWELEQLGLKLVLHILDTGQILELRGGKEFVLGRALDGHPFVPDVDFTPFEGYKWGVSRKHAKLLFQGTEVKVVDLGSTNGTWYGNNRLEPNLPFQMFHGDEIRLGKLKMQVLIYREVKEKRGLFDDIKDRLRGGIEGLSQ